MDPFTNIPPELSEYVLQHLTHSELMTATEVSSDWNYVIGSSPVIMKKVKLSMFWLRNARHLTDEVKNVLVKSERRYQNIDFKYHSDHIKDVSDIVGSNNRKWKNVKLERLNFDSTHEIIEFLKLIEDSTVALEMEDVYVYTLNEADYCNFKNLRKLVIKYVESKSFLEKAFFNCQNLRELSVISNDTNPNSIETLKKIFLQNSKLENIHISSPIFQECFKPDTIEKVSFNLKVFKAKDHYRSNIHGPNLSLFIQKQMKSLEEIYIDTIPSSEALKIMSHMPRLRVLHLGNVNFLDNPWSTVQLRVNPKIEVLSFNDSENSFSKMKSLILAAPNVRELRIFSMTQKMMEFLSANATKLEKISMRTIDVTDVTSQDLFPNLKEANVEILTSDLEDHFEAIPVESQNPFVKLVLASTYIMLH